VVAAAAAAAAAEIAVAIVMSRSLLSGAGVGVGLSVVPEPLGTPMGLGGVPVDVSMDTLGPRAFGSLSILGLCNLHAVTLNRDHQREVTANSCRIVN
jgi:hypothetical protein